MTHFEKRGRSYGVFMAISWAGGAFAAFISGILSELSSIFIIHLFVAVIMFFCLGLVSISSADLWSKRIFEVNVNRTKICLPAFKTPRIKIIVKFM